MTPDFDKPEPATDLSRFGYDDVSGLIIDNTHATGEPFKFDPSEGDDGDDAMDEEPADS